jgi:hypothetical protein
MTMLGRVLIAESLKIKRTLALAMVVLAPAFVVILQFLVTYSTADRIAETGRDYWPMLVQNSVMMWALLLLPLFIGLETALLAGLEHGEKNWKSLLALPVPRWTIYLGKLLVAVALLGAAHAVLAGGTLVSGATLHAWRPSLPLTVAPWSPLIAPILRMTVACLLGVAVQHWVSLRWQSFTAAMAFGVFAMFVGFVAAGSGDWGPRIPWSMPIYVLRGADPTIRSVVPAVGLAGAALVTALGCWEFSRREIS